MEFPYENKGMKAVIASVTVIPGRCGASNPESRDSGSGANAPSRNDALRREHRATDQSALLQIDQRLIGLSKRHRRHRNRRDLFSSHEVEQRLRLPEIADIAALDRNRLDRNQRQRPWRATAEQADDDELAALAQAVEAELRRLGIADEIDHRADRPSGLFGQLLERVGRSAIDGRERAGLLG